MYEEDDSINWKVIIYLKKNDEIKKFDITKFVLPDKDLFSEIYLKFKNTGTIDYQDFDFSLEDIIRFISITLKFKHIKMIDFTCAPLAVGRTFIDNGDDRGSDKAEEHANNLEDLFGGKKTLKKKRHHIKKTTYKKRII